MQIYKENPKQIKINEEKNNNSVMDFNEILMKTDLYLNEKNEELIVGNMGEAQMCFKAMKDIYNTRMKEYVTELTFISEKLQKYDEILSKK